MGGGRMIARFALSYPYRFFLLLGLLGGGLHLLLPGDLEERDARGRTPLIRAAEAGDLAGVKRLLARGANLEAREHCGWSALLRAAGNGHLEVVKVLLAHGAQPGVTDKAGYSALMVAVGGGGQDSLAIVQWLAAAGAELDTQDTTLGWSALIWAVKQGNPAMIALLLELGADRELRDHEGLRALDWARRQPGETGQRMAHLLE
jgi:ankyrin repeat protein